jgi:hypothetical protein
MVQVKPACIAPILIAESVSTMPPLPAQCPNCDAAVHGPFCAQCGQETQITVLKLRDFSHEYFQHFVTLESRLWRTLWTLVRYPGMLTTEFLAGRRRRYVRPLPLYISLSFALFLMMALLPQQFVHLDELKAAKGQATGKPFDNGKPFQIDVRTPADNTPHEDLPTLEALETQANLPAWLQPYFKPVVRPYYDAMQRWNKDADGEMKRFVPIFQSKLPYAVFVLVPLFALHTRLLYWRRQRFYAEHFLFALHLHAFAFVTLLIKLPTNSESLSSLLFLAWWVYLTVALQRLMGGRWWPQALRAGYLLFTHALLLGVVLMVTLVATLPVT